MKQKKFILQESEIPTQWYNIQADMPNKPLPPIHPKTHQPLSVDDLAHIFPRECCVQELDTEHAWIDIPEDVLDKYRYYRSTPLVRAYALEQAIDTPAHIYFKNESTNPLGAATVVSKWRGDSEKIIKVLFDLARHYQPSTIFLDEIDSIMSSRGSSQDEHEGSRRMKTELLIQLDGLQKNEGVFLLAASNTPWDLDPALLRRLEKRVMVNLPNKEGREYMIRNFIPEMNQKGINYMKYAEALEGYSGSDIKLLCKEALMTRTRKAINVIEKDTKGRMYGIKDFPVTKEDFEEAMNKVKPAYTYKTELYIKWEKEFGST